MKKKVTVIYALIMILSLQSFGFGQIVWNEGGVIGDPLIDGKTYEYSEMNFITGTPILLEGTVTIPNTSRGGRDKYQIRYNFDLKSKDGSMVILRSITYDVTEEKRPEIGQTIYHSEINKYIEDIKHGPNTYTLGKYNFSDDRLIDNTPAVNYYSGNIYGEKTYYINGNMRTNDGYITDNISSEPFVGYNHKWGAQETQVLNHMIETYIKNPSYDPTLYGSKEYIKWSGKAVVKMSSTKTTQFQYQNTDPQNISFRGNYFKNVTEVNVLDYDYDMPGFEADGSISKRRNTGSDSMRKDVTLDIKSLIAPKIRDIGGMWSEDSIKLMSSLEIFGKPTTYFVPRQQISRVEFAKGLANTITTIEPYTVSDQIRNTRPGVTTPFFDIMPDNPDYNYISYLKDSGIMNGQNSMFNGDQPITRAEAIVLLIRALGIEDMAPLPPYNTHYVDDYLIPEYAKDAIYMANEIGLVTGYEDGTIRPNDYVTKEETAVLLNKYLRHIKDDITSDYREKIINK